MTCTLGCPAAGRMEIHPHAIMRKIQLGEVQELLVSSAIWKCLGCETCYSRCPNEINIPSAIDELKHAAMSSGKAKSISAAFHNIFLGGIKKNGLLFELGLMLRLKIAMKDFFSDTFLGALMIMKGKLSLRPHSLRESGAMKKIFEKSGAGTN
jgi:heterodisulfide reductase subunit C